MQEKKVSVIVPAYNCEKFIKQCIDSILDQLYPNIEIIVINDGSTDNTANLLNSYRDKIFLINQQNCGVSKARNAGIEVSTGDYIMFVDSDDWIENNMISTMIKYADYDTIVRCSYVVEDGKNEKKQNGDVCKVISKDQIYKTLIETYDFNPPYCQLIPRKLIKKKYVTNISMGEDYLFNCYLYSNVKFIKIINNQFYHYRKVENSLVNTKDVEKILKRTEDVIFVYTQLYSFANQWNYKDLDMIEYRIIKELNYQLLQLFQTQELEKYFIKKNLIYFFNKLKDNTKIKKFNKYIIRKIGIYQPAMIFLILNNINFYYLYANSIYKTIYKITHYKDMKRGVS